MKRRNFLLNMAAAPLAMAPFTTMIRDLSAQTPAPAAKPVRLKQSVMGSVWGNSTLSADDKIKTLARIGFKGMDLPSAAQVPLLKSLGMTPTMMTGTGTSMQDGFIRKENHDAIEAATHKGIDDCANLGCPILIGFAGNRRGMPIEQATENTVAIFNRIKPYAEQKKVVLTIEITNSKVVEDARTDQTFNHVQWGLDVCKKVNSPYVKILYDIYHVQIMDGDVVRTLRDNISNICHFHVAGVPGRMEIDGTQELNYPFIAKAIVDTGYTGFIAHEYKPSPGVDVVKDLEKAFDILNV